MNLEIEMQYKKVDSVGDTCLAKKVIYPEKLQPITVLCFTCVRSKQALYLKIQSLFL